MTETAKQIYWANGPLEFSIEHACKPIVRLSEGISLGVAVWKDGRVIAAQRADGTWWTETEP